MTNIEVRFMTIEDDAIFGTAKRETFATLVEAVSAVTAYAQAAGYTNVKYEWEDDSYRFTARTPRGRSGRNVAYAMPDDES